jgi:hypothetical protein
MSLNLIKERSMQSKLVGIAISLSAILAGMAFSQCTQPGTTSDNSDIYSNEEFVIDTTMQGDTGTQGSDTTNMPQDTSSQDGNRDTTNTAPDTLSRDGTNGSDTGMQGSQNGDGTGTTVPSFDPSKIESFPGQVVSVDTMNSEGGNSELILSMKTEGEDLIKVFLAPESYLKNLNLTFKNGDSVKVIGSKTTDSQKKPVIVASQINKNGATYLLRDEKGVPFWPKNEE